jgi:hypothetical protein
MGRTRTMLSCRRCPWSTASAAADLDAAFETVAFALIGHLEQVHALSPGDALAEIAAEVRTRRDTKVPGKARKPTAKKKPPKA